MTCLYSVILLNHETALMETENVLKNQQASIFHIRNCSKIKMDPESKSKQTEVCYRFPPQHDLRVREQTLWRIYIFK